MHGNERDTQRQLNPDLLVAALRRIVQRAHYLQRLPKVRNRLDIGRTGKRALPRFAPATGCQFIVAGFGMMMRQDLGLIFEDGAKLIF
jgi:hypothetical protein